MHRRAYVLFAGLALSLAASPQARATAAEMRPAARPATTAPTVSLSCHIDSQTCEATASGGSGYGYQFDWSWPFVEQYDADGVSGGDISCIPYWGWRTISVTVTDSNNQTGTASTSFFCPA